jgi:hypothetical protein
MKKRFTYEKINNRKIGVYDNNEPVGEITIWLYLHIDEVI